MNLTRFITAIVLSVMLAGPALADHEGYDMQQGAISGGPGTMKQDQDVQQSDAQKSADQKQQDANQSNVDPNKNNDTDHSEPVLPVPMH